MRKKVRGLRRYQEGVRVEWQSLNARITEDNVSESVSEGKGDI